MKRNVKPRKRSRNEPENKKIFTTVEEFSSHFFPKGQSEKEVAKGKERGVKAAENAFTEITKSLQI